METILSGLAGAVIGALITGLVSWRLSKKQPIREWQTKMATDLAEMLGSLLNPYTPDLIRTKEHVWTIQSSFAPMSRVDELSRREPIVNDPVADLVNDYCQALLLYVEGNMQRGELEQRRATARGRARAMVQEAMRRVL